MDRRRIRMIAMAGIAVLSSRAIAQYESQSNNLLLQSSQAITWSEGETNIIQLHGPVQIQLDRATIKADNAVVWLTPIRGTLFEAQRAEVALVGHVQLTESGITRTGDILQVTGTIRGAIRITATERFNRDLSQSDLYRRALSIRPSAVALMPAGSAPTTQTAASGPATRPAGTVEPVMFRAPGQTETVTARDGKLAVILSGGVVLIQNRRDGSLIELQAEKAVLFTNIEKLTELQRSGGPKSLEETIRSAYLEGDVRVIVTPASNNTKEAEQRLSAHRIFFDFTTDRAVLTDAVLHSSSPKIPVPMLVRADTMRMLSIGEYTANNVQLTTSEFATPSYSLAADRAYIRQMDTGDPIQGVATTFQAQNVTLQAFGVPYFYLPATSGTITQDMPLRSITFGSSSHFGFYGITNWGLFPTLGKLPPPGVDADYNVGYYGDRGPAGGLNASYGGSDISDTTKNPWSFEGKLKSFFVYDHGTDEFGGERSDVEPNQEFRGHVLWEHQHFFPDDWQIQLRAGWVSDPTFLEEWIRRNRGVEEEPHDLSVYLKKQTDTESFTLLATIQPNNFVTTTEMYQEQFEVERLPEIGYHRIGDSPFSDNFTFFSDNSASALRFDRSSATLAQLGFPGGLSPGIPALGLTGVSGVPVVPETTVYRGDFRDELDYPFSIGQVRAVPYVMGRYTTYSDSPSDQAKNRFFSGAGARLSTTFWKVDDTTESDLFDIHRVRHIIEPSINVFTSASTVDEGDLFIYDEDVDRINDLSAAQFSLHQTWQTQRGGPGHWRSVDFLTLNVEGDFFTNVPPDPELRPLSFRGLFFDSLPEASIPRDSINADSSWRVTDTFAVLSDASYNTNEGDLATAATGVAVRQDPRIIYFFGLRYIGPLDSTIGTFSVNYQLSPKYLLEFTQSYDFSATSNVESSIEIVRHFDKFWFSVRVFRDSVNDDSGVQFLLYPEGLNPRGSASTLSESLQPRH